MIALRQAVEEDSHDILSWRNDPLTRAMSRSAAAVAPQAHDRWFHDALRRADRILYIGLQQADPLKVGVIRLDIGANQAEISINLNPQARGRGLASPFLAAALAAFHATRPHTVVAAVKQANPSSLKTFLNAGFAEVKRIEGMVILHRPRAGASARRERYPQDAPRWPSPSVLPQAPKKGCVMNKRAITIAGRVIGPGAPPYVVAELSGNHNGDIERAFAIMEAAKRAGADAVKLQTYTADTLTIDCDAPDFRIDSGPWRGRTLYELYQEAHTPFEWHEALFAKGRELGIAVFSAPFDESAVELLERLDAPAYKIASFEAPDHALVARAARAGKPLIISTGMAALAEIDETVRLARDNGAKDLILLHCISAYPAPADQANLRTIAHLAQTFDVLAGLSDHTLGLAVPIAAVALGACFIEKHLTLDTADGGPDAAFSLEPDEFARLCESVKTAHLAIGRVSYDRQQAETPSLAFRRSLYVVKDIKEGEPLRREAVRSIRPGFGLAPKHLEAVLSRTAARDLKRGEPLSWDVLR